MTVKETGVCLALLLLSGCTSRMNNGGQSAPLPSYRYKKSTEEKQPKKMKTETPKPVKRDPSTMSHEELLNSYLELTGQEGVQSAEGEGTLAETSLDFKVKNKTGKGIYVTAFTYIKKEPNQPWRWDKSHVLAIAPGQTRVIDIDEIADEEIRKGVYGYLAILDTKEAAEAATPQLIDDRKLLDLDLVQRIKGKTLTVEIEKYSGRIQKFDYKLESDNGAEPYQPELDFFVENQTGKPIYTCCFIYEQQQDSESLAAWKYSKTGTQFLLPGETAIIDVSSIRNQYAWVYMRGALAIFDEHEKEDAEKASYELLPPEKRLALGRLSSLQGQKVVLEVEKYGAIGEFIDYVTKPVTPVRHN